MTDDVKVVACAHQFPGIDRGNDQSSLTNKRACQNVTIRIYDDAGSSIKRTILIPTRHINSKRLWRRLYLTCSNDKATPFICNMPH